MNPQDEQPRLNDESQPVAYDSQGHPLYMHPDHPDATAQPVVLPTVVHVARPLKPERQVVSPEAQRLHERSLRLYPTLNLSTGEYVISAVRRHPIGLVLPLAVGTLLIGMLLAVLVNYDAFVEHLNLAGPLADIQSVALPMLFLVAITIFGMFVSYYVYTKNKFYLTNETVVQHIQQTLFSRKEQTVSLANIEDASYTQSGILQQIFDYGSIRLSTEGDETSYQFTYVAHPKERIARLNEAVEAFKNGRPVDNG